MVELLNAGLRGANRMGVVDAPWWPFIKKCMIPLLHIIIGIFNDIDQHYLKVLDKKVIAKSADEKRVIIELAKIEEEIKSLKVQLDEWNASAEGKKLVELEKKTKKQDKALRQGVSDNQTLVFMSVDEVKERQRLKTAQRLYITKGSKAERKKSDLEDELLNCGRSK